MAKSSLLSKLTLAERPERPKLSATQQRRRKLLTRLQERRELARRMIAGETFTATKQKWITNPETGAREKKTLPKLVKPWYYQIDSVFYFEVRYGNKPLELEKGKGAVLVGSIDKLLVVIDLIISASVAGELDSMFNPKP